MKFDLEKYKTYWFELTPTKVKTILHRMRIQKLHDAKKYLRLSNSIEHKGNSRGDVYYESHKESLKEARALLVAIKNLNRITEP